MYLIREAAKKVIFLAEKPLPPNLCGQVAKKRFYFTVLSEAQSTSEFPEFCIDKFADFQLFINRNLTTLVSK